MPTAKTIKDRTKPISYLVSKKKVIHFNSIFSGHNIFDELYSLTEQNF
jgi:hypothetical protein